MTEFIELNSDLDFTPLNVKLSLLVQLCTEACDNCDQYIFRKALKVLSSIEEILWKYYMEVYSK